MEQTGTILAAALALGVGAFVVWALGRAQGARAARRAGYLAACAPLFADRMEAVQPSGFPRLSGRHEGDLFDVQVIPDTLSVRKLPALWVLVSLPGDLPVHDTVDLMMRATGLETFSHFARLPVQVPAPAGFPPDCAIRTDAPGVMPFADSVRRVLEAVDMQRLKEVLVTPKGVRLVFLAEEAQRSRYLLYRDAEMGRDPLPPARLAPFLAAVQALRDGVLLDVAGRRKA